MANYYNKIPDPIVCLPKFEDLEWEEVTDVIDVSYTKSFYPDTDMWLSHHDYHPQGIFATRTELFSFFDKELYIHNQNNFGKFYKGIYHKSIMTPVFKSPYRTREKLLSALFKNINYRNDIIENKKVNRNKTFTRLSFHNSYQSSKKITLIPFQDTERFLTQYDNFNVRLNHNYWRFNKIRDLKLDKRELTWEEWKSVEKIVFNETIDEIDVNNNIEENQEVQLKRKFIDDYLIVIIEFDNNINNSQFLFNEIDCETSPALR